MKRFVNLPLYGKILLLLSANLLLVALLFITFFKLQLNFGPESLLTGRTGERLRSFSDLIADDLRDSPEDEWKAILERFSKAYDVQLRVYRDAEHQLAGPSLTLPAEVARSLGRRPGGRPNRQRPDGEDRPDRQRPDRPDRDASDPQRLLDNERYREFVAGMIEHRPKPELTFLRKTGGTEQSYWVGVRLPLASLDYPHPFAAMLVIQSSNIFGHGLFLDIGPWIVVAMGVLMLCVLFWWPFVHGITRYLRQMTEATESIATGSFSVHVSEARHDELGRLGFAINKMAKRLQGYVSGQKRFMGDIAHELCSPVARMRLALSVLEQRATADQAHYVEDVSEELTHMSDMVDELLAFSKASLKPMSMSLSAVPLLPVVERALRREGGESAEIELRIPEAMTVLAEEGLLFRTLANVVRNAISYAGSAGPITLAASEQNDRVILRIYDCGPGVPANALDRILDPFFRPEASRSPESGGTGLGLAIVKTCMESCEGRVTCSNREEGGFEVELDFKKAP